MLRKHAAFIEGMALLLLFGSGKQSEVARSLDSPDAAGAAPEVFDLGPLEMAILLNGELPISGEGLTDAHELLTFLTLKAVEQSLTRKILAQSSNITAITTAMEEGRWLH